MKTAATSATSSMKAEALELGKVFASLGFVGDCLEPQDVTRILRISPTKSWRKGELFRPGPRSPEIIAHTGAWWLSTEGLVAGGDLDDHLGFLVTLVSPKGDRGERLGRLREIIQDGATARVSCFWHGDAAARPPTIAASAVAAFNRLPADIEADFDTD
jgi:hypothetical protein